MATDLAPALELLGAARRVMVTCHLAPDGDAVGSMSALAALLGAAGRTVTLYNPDPAPRALRFLPHIARLGPRPAGPHDLTIVVDCGDRKLLGPRFPGPEVTGPLLVLDHHATSRPFGDVYFCDPAAASIGVLCARLADRLGWPIDTDAAQGIYVSLVSDTGWFRYANTNAEAFALAARLVEAGAVDPWAVAQRLGEEIPLARYRLLAAALAAIELEHGGRVALLTVTEAMVRAAGAKWEHTEGLVGYARAIEGVEVGCLLAPGREGGTRVSLRAKGKIDAGAVCAQFGGGGHPGAAGCTLPVAPDAARVLILEALGVALCATASSPSTSPAD
jgi:phosphoesterase RecJ-like protein